MSGARPGRNARRNGAWAALLVLLASAISLLQAPAAHADATFPVYAPWDSGATYAVGNPPNSGVGGGYYGHCCSGYPSEYYAVDINGPGGGNADCGVNIRATNDGTVSSVDTYTGGISYMRLDHGAVAAGYTSEYQHITNAAPQGTIVHRGDVIAKMGNVGTTYCHLHFIVKKNGTSVAPSPMSGTVLPASGGIYVTSNNSPAVPPAPPSAAPGDVPASGTTHTAAGDFNGDGHDDVATLYNYGGNNSAIYEFQGSATGLSAPAVQKFASGPGNWSWDQSKVTASDVNGDGYSDFIVLYDYSNAVTGMNVFTGSATGLSSSWTQMWGASAWLWANTKIIGGDYDGDGIGDVAAMYDYGGGNTAIFMFKGNTSGSLSAVKYWESGPGNFPWVNTKSFAMDANGDGKSELLALYNYGGASVSLFSFSLVSAATSQFTQPWSSNGWYWSSSKFTTGDFNHDGYGDIAAMYDYGSCDTGMFIFSGSSTGVQSPTQPWRTGPGQWCLSNVKMASGSFTGSGDSLEDVAAFYDYGSANTGLFILPGSTLARQSAYANWASGTGQWGWDRM